MSKRDMKLFIVDIAESIDAIFEYVADMTLEEFQEDRKTYSAVIREFEIIGEAVKHLPQELTKNYPDIAWRDIQDFRNMLIHEYFGVDFDIIWNVIKDDLPNLKLVIKNIAIFDIEN